MSNPYRDKLASIGYLSRGRTQARVKSGRVHPDSGEPFKKTLDELGNVVTEHGQGGVGGVGPAGCPHLPAGAGCDRGGNMSDQTQAAMDEAVTAFLAGDVLTRADVEAAALTHLDSEPAGYDELRDVYEQSAGRPGRGPG